MVPREGGGARRGGGGGEAGHEAEAGGGPEAGGWAGQRPRGRAAGHRPALQRQGRGPGAPPPDSRLTDTRSSAKIL